MIVIIWCIIPFLLGVCCYYYLNRNFDCWKEQNVKGPDPILLFGNCKDNIFGKIHKAELTKKFYDEFPGERMVGYFVRNTPVLLLRDPDLIKDVLVKDFSSFSDRGIHIFDKVEPMSQHMFNLPESTWRPLRAKLSPAFTIAKIKEAYEPILDVTDRFVAFVEEESRHADSLEIREVVARFTTEVIGEYGFGLKMHELTEEVSEFRMINKSKQQKNWYNSFRRLLREYLPSIYEHASYLRNDEMSNYYPDVISNIIEYRKSNGVKKNDFIGLLIDLKDNPQKISDIELSDNMLAAQVYLFFIAGSDSAAITISNAFYELAMNASIQEKLRQEIHDIKSYSLYDIKNMKYLEQVFQETLRKYPLRNIIRKSNKTYTFAGTNVTIPANTHITIPLHAIHRDSQLYPEPEIFKPERFDDCTKKAPGSYLPFGDGPRYCIGKQFAVYITKIVIVKIIQNFKVQICSKRNENDASKVFLWPKGGVRLKFCKL